MRIVWYASSDCLYGRMMAVCCLLGSFALSAQEPVRQSGSKGYIHPGQHMVRQAQAIAENMEPVIVNREQEQRAQDKLKALEKKAKKKPNIVIFLLDDVGWMDMGFNGGGIAVGNPTPNIDRPGRLTGTYSDLSLLPAFLFSDQSYDYDRSVSCASWYIESADVRAARRARRTYNGGKAAFRSGLCHAGCRQMAYGRK